MRIRSIKPEYWQHAMHEGLSREASILGAALQNFVDDEGRGEGSAMKIKSMVVPCFDMDVEGVLAELEAINFIILYEVAEGAKKRRLLQVTTFMRHQSVSHPTPSILPPPPGWVFVMDPKPENWSEKKGKWRRGRWYRKDALEGLPLGAYPARAQGEGAQKGGIEHCALSSEQGSSKGAEGGLREDSGSGPGEVREESSKADGGHQEDSNLARARTGTGTGTRRGQGGEGAGAPPARDGLDGSGSGGSGFHVEQRGSGPRPEGYPSDANVPTLEEVAGFGAGLLPTAAPGDYAEAWFGHWTADRLWWNGTGRLKDWKHHFRNWWAADVLTWGQGGHRWQRLAGGATKNGEKAGQNGGGLLVWRQIEELKRAIGEHPANKGTGDRPNAFYQPRCSNVQRAGLAELERQLADLTAGNVEK
jgi:hypothetical protein